MIEEKGWIIWRSSESHIAANPYMNSIVKTWPAYPTLKEGEASTGQTIDMLRDGAQTAISSGDDRFLADALRLLGEIEEAAENPDAAFHAYDKALQANPKIGVTRRAAALRKSTEHSQH